MGFPEKKLFFSILNIINFSLWKFDRETKSTGAMFHYPFIHPYIHSMIGLSLLYEAATLVQISSDVIMCCRGGALLYSKLKTIVYFCSIQINCINIIINYIVLINNTIHSMRCNFSDLSLKHIIYTQLRLTNWKYDFTIFCFIHFLLQFLN